MNILQNKEERYSRVPRLSDTRYSKGNGDMQNPAPEEWPEQQRAEKITNPRVRALLG